VDDRGREVRSVAEVRALEKKLRYLKRVWAYRLRRWALTGADTSRNPIKAAVKAEEEWRGRLHG